MSLKFLKYNRSRAVKLVFAVVFVFSSVGFGITENDLQQQMDQTKKKLTQTKIKENSVLGSLLRTQLELEKISNNLNRLTSNIGNTQKRMKLIEEQLFSAQNELEKLKIEIGGREGVLDQRLIAIYKYGYQSYLEILLSADDFADFISRCEMLGNYVRVDLHILRSLQSQQNLISKKREEVAKKQRELQIQKEIYSRLQIQATQQQSRQMSTMKEKQRELSTIQNDRKILEEAYDELERLSESMVSQIRDQNKNRASLGTGRYSWPTPGNITSEFGNRIHPILRKRKFHSGIDISAPIGIDIVASDTGIVTYSGRNGGYGKMITVFHGNGITTTYAHCSVLLVTVDQVVNKGQVIAKVGNTGLSTGPHLHFEVRKDGVPVDPLEYL